MIYLMNDLGKSFQVSLKYNHLFLIGEFNFTKSYGVNSNSLFAILDSQRCIIISSLLLKQYLNNSACSCFTLFLMMYY